MRRWMGGRKFFNGLGGISADPLTSFLAPYSLSHWGEGVCYGHDRPQLSALQALTGLWFVDTVLEAGKEVLEED